MKYTLEITIKKPLNTVVSLFSNPNLLQNWQTGFISYKHKSGAYGLVGSINQLHFKMKKRDIILDEMIEVLDLPRNFTATYTTKGIWNRNVNSFKAIDDTTTQWTSHNEFTFLGLYKILKPFISASIKKQSKDTLNCFKEFAENKIKY